MPPTLKDLKHQKEDRHSLLLACLEVCIEKGLDREVFAMRKKLFGDTQDLKNARLPVCPENPLD